MIEEAEVIKSGVSFVVSQLVNTSCPHPGHFSAILGSDKKSRFLDIYCIEAWEHQMPNNSSFENCKVETDGSLGFKRFATRLYKDG